MSLIFKEVHHFPLPGEPPYKDVYAEAEWLGTAKTDADLIIKINYERLQYHAFSNTSKAFVGIIDYLSTAPHQKHYSARISVEKPSIIRGKWGRDAAIAFLQDMPLEFSFQEGSIDGYKTINATFYAYKRGADKNTGARVNIHLETTKDASFQSSEGSALGKGLRQ